MSAERRKNWKTDPAMLTPAQVTETYGIAEQTLANWRSQDKGPAWVKISGEVGKPGGLVMYHPEAVEAFLRGRSVTPAA